MDIVWLAAGWLFRWFRRVDSLHQQLTIRRLTVDWPHLLALVMTVLLVAYLTTALLKPEKFL